jgi:two-component system, cell cycle sensor histidine kinase and response regulator CckA
MGDTSFEMLLHSSQAMITNILDSVRTAILIIDRSGSCAYLNRECTSLTGYTLDDERADQRLWKQITKKIREDSITDPNPYSIINKSVIIKTIPVMCRNGEINALQVHISTQNDGSHVVTISDYKQKNQNGKSIPTIESAKLSVHSQEITFNEVAEKSLALIGVFVVQDELFKYANERFSETFGYSVEELINHLKPRDLVFENDWSILSQISDPHSILNCISINKEFRGVTKNGEIIYLELFASPTVINDKTAVIGAIIDISKHARAKDKLQKAEEKYRHIFENSLLGIFQVDSRGRFISANLAVAKIHGYDSSEELIANIKDIGKDLFIYQEQLTEINKLINEKGFIDGFEAEMRRKNGSTHWVSLSMRPIKDNIDNTICFEGTIQEITEKKKIEGQLFQSQKMEAIGTLAGGVAHDFNNLLMGIQGYASLMLFNMDSTHEHYDKLKNIEQLVRSGADLTKQLLGFARVGRYQVRVADLREILSSVANTFMRTKKEITVHERYEKDLYPVEVDQNQIETVFLSLFINAWEAMSGGGHLYIEARNTILDEYYPRLSGIKPGKFVKVSVTDTGIGMDEKTMKRIFEPFFTTKEMGRGTGLGLASVYGIVKGHKGLINCYSQLGHGTTFNVYFPSSIADQEDNNVHENEKLPKGTETILLVDDEEMIISVGEEILKTLGYEVIVARGGLEAIDLFAQNRNQIGVVILDMIMPDLEGGKTFDALRRIDQNVKVILSSGYSLNSEAENIMQRGCNAFMQKPFNAYTLSRTLRTVINN